MRTLRRVITVASLAVAILAGGAFPTCALAATYSIEGVRVIDPSTGVAPVAGSTLTKDGGHTLLVDDAATVTLAFDLVDGDGATVSGPTCSVTVAGVSGPLVATYTSLSAGGSHYVVNVTPNARRDISLLDDLAFSVDDGTGAAAPSAVSLDTGIVESLGFVDGDAAATAGMGDSAKVELLVTAEGDSIVGDQDVYPTVESDLLAVVDAGALPDTMGVTVTDSLGVRKSSIVTLAQDGAGTLRATTPVSLGGVGAFRVDTSYAYDLSMYYGFSTASPQTVSFSRTIVVDVSGPEAAHITGMPDATSSSVSSGYLYHAGRTLLFTIDDDASGVVADDVSVDYITRDYLGNVLERGSARALFDGSSYRITLPADSLVALGDLTVHAHDRAGRLIKSGTPEPIPYVTSAGERVTHLITTSPGQVPSDLVDFEPDTSTNEWVKAPDGSSVPDDVLFVSNGTATPTVVMSVHDPLLPLLGWNPYDAGGDAARIGDAFAATRVTTDPDNPLPAPAFVNTDTRYVPSTATYVTPYRLPDEGLYKLSLTYRSSQPNERYYVVDSHAPTPRQATIVGDSADWTAAYEDGHTELIGDGRAIDIDVPDLLGGTEDRRLDADGRPTTAGTKRVWLVVPHKTDPSQDEWDSTPTTLVAHQRGATDTWRVMLEEPGVYDLVNAKVHASDHLGNEAREEDVPALASLLDQGMPQPTIIHVIPDTQADPTVTIHGAADVAVTNPGYYKGGVRASVSVADPWIDVYRHVSGYADGTVSYDITRGGIPYVGAKPTLSLADLTDDDGDGVWTHDYWFVDPASPPEAPLPIEGTYTVHAAHVWWRGVTSSAARPSTFVADHTPSTMGTLTSSNTAPVRWGYIFVDGVETLSVTVSDLISGIDAATATATLVGPTREQAPASYDPFTSSLSVTLAGDGQRLFLEGSSMGISDMANNQTPMPTFAALLRLGRTNLPEGIVGIVIDTEAPTLEVSYDNTDVRNGRYYNAQRVATFTLTESNFDLVKANDGSREIVTMTHDGEARPIPASRFENPSGDGITWVATETISTDGDWIIDGSFVDPVGHLSDGIHDEFTIDTMAPMLTIDFDNNDVRNGRYYNRGRTATVTLVERNPAEPPAEVITQATDAAGTAVGAPGITGWGQTGERYGWATTVGFYDDLHYTISARATDLAGNEAVEVEVPEFVIDTTAPEVSIDRVDDKAAYAGEIAPAVAMSDVNYDPGASKHSLTGAHSGEVDYLPGMERSYEETGESVTYADFEHALERDDVYTIAAHAEDLAGNAVDQSKVFSVNRFGSNYLYSDETAALRGTYVRSARDVVITEVNVSGLVDEDTVVELVRNDEVHTLVADEDYRTEKGDDAGWSTTTYTVPASTFDGDAYYRLLLTSRDRAGNLSQNTMEDKDADRTGVASVSFAVDGTKPTTGFAGVRSYGLYFGPDWESAPLAGDNLELASATVQLDGGDPVEYTAEQVAAGDLSCLVPSDAQYHTVTVTALDRAGNISTAVATNVVVAANWWEFLKAHPRILFGIVASALVALGALVAGIVLGVRHYRRTEPARNPFGH